MSTLEGHESEVKCVQWSQDGKYLATCSRDKNIWIWETNDEFDYECCAILSGHSQDVKALKWNSRLEMLFSSSYDDTIKSWRYDDSLDDWTNIYTMEGHTSTVWSLDFDPTEQYLVSVGDDKIWMIWEVQADSYKNKGKAEGSHDRTIFSTSWASVNNLIATVSGI